MADDEDCRAVVISGAGRGFCSGIDLMDAAKLAQTDPDMDIGRRALRMRKLVKEYQDSFTAIEKVYCSLLVKFSYLSRIVIFQCKKPVIAAIHGPCIGGATGLLTATDIRYATQDAMFQIKVTHRKFLQIEVVKNCCGDRKLN